MPTILLNLRASAGALLRTLGTVEQCGHEIVAMRAARAAAVLNVDLQVTQSAQEPDALTRALHRLPDVLDARLHRESSSPAADGWSIDTVEPRPQTSGREG